jgi:hypothetical protein
MVLDADIKFGDDRQYPNEQQCKKKDAKEHNNKQASGDMVGLALPKHPVTINTATNGHELSATHKDTEHIKAR